MLHSDWLLKMMEKSGSNPRSRMLALFDLLHDWAGAPGVCGTLEKNAYLSGSAAGLLDYLARQARLSGIPDPDALAHQVYFIALGALRAELASSGGNAILQAKQAATVLLGAHAQAVPRRTQSVLMAGLMAGVTGLFLLALAGIMLPSGNDNGFIPQPQSIAKAQTSPAAHVALRTQPAPQLNSPDQVASLHDLLERIRQGVCQYPQALMLAPEQRAIFLEHVVNSTASAGPADMREIRELVRKVECYYPPVAMTAS